MTIRSFLPVGVAAGLVLTLAACGGGEEKKASAPQRQSVTAAAATQTTLARTVVASGTVEAWEMVPVGAETGGLTAVALFVDEGAWVRQGQPLVQMNDVLLRAQLRQQQAQVRRPRPIWRATTPPWPARRS